jgi:branched-chain amino acid transport system substrate-binding protein
VKRSTRPGITKLRAVGVVGMAAVLALSACGRGESGGGGGGGGEASDPGITDDTIRLGANYPASGPASAYAGVNKGISAAFRAANAEGGVEMGDGKTREIEYILYDDAYTPDKALANARRLVENDEVFALAGSFGTPGNTAIAPYVESQKVPSIDIFSSAAEWRDPERENPYVTSWGFTGLQEHSAMTADILEQDPNAKVGIIFQNDETGRPATELMEKLLADAGGELVAKETYDITAPTVDSQVTNLAGSGADFVVWGTGPKQVVQAIQKSAALGWQPQMYVPAANSSIPSVMQPAGPGAVGARSVVYAKNPVDPQWADDPAVKEFQEVIAKYGDGASPDDAYAFTGYVMGQSILAQLERLEEPTREALMELAKDYSQEYDVPTLLEGVKFNEASTDLEDTGLRIQEFDGTTWNLVE